MNGGTQRGDGLLHRFLSIGDQLNVPDGGHGGGRGAISVSTGYLNIKDVFYPGSITGITFEEECERICKVGIF